MQLQLMTNPILQSKKSRRDFRFISRIVVPYLFDQKLKISNGNMLRMNNTKQEQNRLLTKHIVS